MGDKLKGWDSPSIKKEQKFINTKVYKKNKDIKINKKDLPTLKLKNEHDIAMDFAIKVVEKFNKIIKSVVLFGSSTKKERVTGSDIDIIIIVDDASIKWDQKLIVWYRTELGKILQENPYKNSLHINTIKLTTWWQDLIRGDPLILNILRNSEILVDLAGFFEPLKFLLIEGKIKSSPEAVYACLQRAPIHLARSKTAELASIEGLYWAMVDSAHAALITLGIFPPSPEHITEELKKNFVDKGMLKVEYIRWYRELLILHKQISHGEIINLKGVEIDDWQKKTEDFVQTMAKLVEKIIGDKN